MKRYIITVVLCLCAIMGVQAQNAQVAKIRKMYAEAKEVMANKKKAEVPPDETVVTSNYMAPGAGPIKDVTHYYYNGEFDENLGNVYYTPFFMTRNYNVGARNYYEEFLYDKEGSLVFYFNKSQNDETRYYWGAGGFFHEDIKGQKMMDEVFAARLANDLKEAFHRLMNREY